MWNDHISASLICLDPLNLERDIDILLAKGIYRFHADFMDGVLVPRLGLAPEAIQGIKKKFNDRVVIDSHLMLKAPEKYFDVVAPYSDWVTIHYEAQEDPLRLVQTLKRNFSCKVVIAFNVLTEIPEWVLLCDDIDGILLMGISPGVLDTLHYSEIIRKKLFRIRKEYRYSKAIFIDGSIKFSTLPSYFTNGKVKKNLVAVCGSSTLLSGIKTLADDSILEKNIGELQKCIQ